MPYLIDASDAPGKADLRQRVRPEHLAYLEAKAHLLLAAGAKLADDGEAARGSVYIVDTEDRAAAQAFIDADPFTKNGVFGTIAITRWRKGYFNFVRVAPPAKPAGSESR